MNSTKKSINNNLSVICYNCVRENSRQEPFNISVHHCFFPYEINSNFKFSFMFGETFFYFRVLLRSAATRKNKLLITSSSGEKEKKTLRTQCRK